MHPRGHVRCELPLQQPLVWGLRVFGDQRLHLLPIAGGEDLQEAGRVVVAGVQPELVEAIGRGAGLVQPHVAAFALAELAAVGLGEQRRGDGVRLAPVHAADQLGAGGDVAPLVAAAQLQLHVHVGVQVLEVIALHQLVTELGEGEARLQAVLHGVLGHHVVHGDVLAHVADEAQEAHVLEPVVVVHQAGAVGPIAEVQEAFQLGADAGHVVREHLLAEQVAFGALAAGIAHHAGGAAHEGHGAVPAALEVHQQHDGHEVAHVQRVGGGVEAHVAAHGSAFQQVLHTGRVVLQHAAPAQFRDVVLHGVARR